MTRGIALASVLREDGQLVSAGYVLDLLKEVSRLQYLLDNAPCTPTAKPAKDYFGQPVPITIDGTEGQ